MPILPLKNEFCQQHKLHTAEEIQQLVISVGAFKQALVEGPGRTCRRDLFLFRGSKHNTGAQGLLQYGTTDDNQDKQQG